MIQKERVFQGLLYGLVSMVKVECIGVVSLEWTVLSFVGGVLFVVVYTYN